MKRRILHCDMNNYYATVEAMLNPDLRGLPLAVCGSSEERHGIVLAKSQEAKAKGIRTGEAIWEARLKCPDLLVVPPHFEEYVRLSKEARKIYYRFTEKIEPFGIDECWLDLSGTEGLFGPIEEVGEKIRTAIREELGLTISVGLSFNKIFAKLASDLADRDASYLIGEEDWQEKVHPLPADTLLGVGWATRKKLARYGIHTIGDLAGTDPDFLRRLLGINGLRLQHYAQGLDTARVRVLDEGIPVKTVGHGITLTQNIEEDPDVHHVLLELSLDVSYRLNKLGLMAGGVELFVRDEHLTWFGYQTTLSAKTASPAVLAQVGLRLFQEKYPRQALIRALSIRAIALRPRGESEQLDLLGEYLIRERQEKISDTLIQIRKRYGRGMLTYGALLGESKIPKGRSQELLMPGPMQR